ncbi:MAG: hypothetical protein ACYCZH_06200 [Sulfuriferula sp.]
MTPKFDQILKRLNNLIEKADILLSTVQQDPEYAKSKDKREIVDPFEFVRFRTASLHFIETTLGKETQYHNAFWYQCQSNAPHHVKVGKALLEELLMELNSSWLWSTHGIATAEVYADFLEMAEGLLDAGYKDAAAVMIGGVLEEHLRRLCIKNGITTTHEKDGKTSQKKADTMNSDLASASIYSKLDQKWVTTALDLRNKAAHGHYEQYDKDQVRAILLQSTTNFLQRQPV